MRKLLKLVLSELSRGGGGGCEFGHGDLDAFFVKENGSGNTESSSSESEQNEGVPHERSEEGGGDHHNLVDEVALDHKQSADDAAGRHPEGVRHSGLLLVDVPVQSVNGSENSADVDSDAILYGVVEGVVEPGLQHVVDGGGGSVGDGGGGELAINGVVGRHGVVYVVHFVTKIRRENKLFSSRKVDRQASPTNAQVRKADFRNVCTK